MESDGLEALLDFMDDPAPGAAEGAGAAVTSPEAVVMPPPGLTAGPAAPPAADDEAAIREQIAALQRQLELRKRKASGLVTAPKLAQPSALEPGSPAAKIPRVSASTGSSAPLASLAAAVPTEGRAAGPVQREGKHVRGGDRSSGPSAPGPMTTSARVTVKQQASLSVTSATKLPPATDRREAFSGLSIRFVATPRQCAGT